MYFLKSSNDSRAAFVRLNFSLGAYGQANLSENDLIRSFGWLTCSELNQYFCQLMADNDCSDWFQILAFDHVITRGNEFDFDNFAPVRSFPSALSLVMAAIDHRRLYPSRVSVDDNSITFYVSDQAVFRINNITFANAPAIRSKRISSALKGYSGDSVSFPMKQLSKIPGLGSIRLLERTDRAPIVYSLSTIVSLMMVSLSEIDIFIQRGHVQECLAAFLKVPSWNHLIAREKCGAVIFPTSLARWSPSTAVDGERIWIPQYEYYRNSPDGLAALSELVHTSNIKLFVTTSTSSGRLVAQTHTSPPSPGEMYSFEFDDHSSCPFSLEYLSAHEDLDYSTVCSEFANIDRPLLAEAIVAFFGHTKQNRLAGSHRRRDIKSIALGPWLVCRRKFDFRWHGWFELLDEAGHPHHIWWKWAKHSQVDFLDSNIMINQNGDCVIVQEKLEDCLLPGLSLDEISKLAAFFDLSFNDKLIYEDFNSVTNPDAPSPLSPSVPG